MNHNLSRRIQHYPKGFTETELRELEEQSFVNLVRFFNRELRRLHRGEPSGLTNTKITTFRKHGVLIAQRGRRQYGLSDKAKTILRVK